MSDRIPNERTTTQAERQIGMLPLPARPTSLSEPLAGLDELLHRIVVGKEPVHAEFARALDELRRDPRLRSAGPALRREIEVRSGVAQNWLGTLGPDLARLDEALVRLDSARRIGVPTAVEAARIDTVAATTLTTRYQLAGAQADLDEATRAAQRVHDAQGGGHPYVHRRGEWLLATALGIVFRRGGDVAVLDRAIVHAEEAVRLSLGGPFAQSAATELAELRNYRFGLTGSIDDLQRGIELLRSLSRSEGEGVVTFLGVLLRNRYRRLGDPADLDEAITILSGEADGGTDPASLTNLGNSLLTRWEARGDPDDLARAVDMQRRAVEETWPGDYQRASRYNNLGNALSAAARAGDDAAFLDEARAAYSTALDLTDPREPERSSRELNLARVLLDSAVVDGEVDRAGLDAALDGFRRAVEVGLDGALEWALRAAVEWGRVAAWRADWPDAAAAQGRAVTALERLFDVQLLRSEKLAWLGQASSVFADDAWVRVRTGDARDAALAADRGRALLLREELAQREVDLARLRAAGHVDLADRYLAARRRWGEVLRGAAGPAAASGR